MKAGTMEGLIGASRNMKLTNTPMRVYRDAERRGDLAVMERALGYAGDFAEEAYECKDRAEEALCREMKEEREVQEQEREAALEKSRAEAKLRQEQQMEQAVGPAALVEISAAGQKALQEQSAAGGNAFQGQSAAGGNVFQGQNAAQGNPAAGLTTQPFSESGTLPETKVYSGQGASVKTASNQPRISIGV